MSKPKAKPKDMHPVTAYAWEVVYGSMGKMCGKWEILACKRHLEDMEKSKKKSYPYILDETRADRIIRHFQNVPRLDAPGEHIELEDWQIFDYGCQFGWVHKDTGKRRFKIGYNRIARGHAKTTCAAGIACYFMCGDAMYRPYHPEEAKYEYEPWINIVAVDRKQGGIARSDISGMIDKTPAFKKRLTVKKTYIEHKTRGGKVEVFSKDSSNKDGGRPTLIITEEWHAHPTDAVHNVAVSSMGKKWQCFELIITTAGTDAENKPCYRDDKYYKMILDGEATQEDVFVMIREIDDDDDPHDKSCWLKSQPFFRHMEPYAKTLYAEVVSQYETAYQSGDPGKIREFLIKRMNRWQADAENKYFSGCMEKFKELAVSRKEFAELTAGSKGYYGFDLGKTTDLSGTGYATLLKDGRLAVSVHGFMPQNRATEHEHSDRVPYKDWAESGWVTLTPGDVTDNTYVEQWIYDKEESMDWKVAEVDYDGHNATDMALRMATTYGEEKIVEIAQTCAGQNQAVKRFRELVLQGKVVHDGSPLMYWCLGNAIEIQNNYGDIKLSKRHKDDSQRIDPVAGLMNALARLIVVIDNKVDKSEIIKKRGYAMK